MNKQNLMKMMCAACCLMLAQSAFAQKNLSGVVKRLGNSAAEKKALSEMFKPAAAKTTAKDITLSPAAGRALSGAKAAAFKGGDAKVAASVDRALEQARQKTLASYQVDTRVFLTDGFLSKFTGYNNPVVFMNVSPNSSVGALELFEKLGPGMVNRRMYVQTEDGSMIVLFNSVSQNLSDGLLTVLKELVRGGKYNSVQAFNVHSKTAYFVSDKYKGVEEHRVTGGFNFSYSVGDKYDGIAVQHLTGDNLEAFAASLGRAKKAFTFRPLTPAAKANAVRFMIHTVAQFDPASAMVVLESKGIQKLAAEFPVKKAVLVKVTTPFATRELGNVIWNRSSGQNLFWEQNVFFQNGDYGDDLLLQTAVPELRAALKYDYRLIVHDAR